MAIRSVNDLIAGLGIWWKNLRAARKDIIVPPSHLIQLPEGIKVIRQNTTRPLVKTCSNCQYIARASAAFCPKCGISLAPPEATLEPSLNLQPYVIEPVSNKLPEVHVRSGSHGEVSEIVHIDLMLKVKLYLLWDKAGR